MRTTLATGLLIVGLLGAAPAEAQRFSCGGHHIHWVGGAPAASADPAGADRGRSSGAPGASFDPKHEAGQQPTIDEPAGLNRERWDALVFDGWERKFYFGEQTAVLDRATVPTIRICIQSSDTSNTGERLAPYSDASWWRRQINRWTNLSWSGEIRIAACTDEPQEGWIHVREGRPGEVGDHALAHVSSWRENHPHSAGRWLRSEIVWNPDHVPDTDESYFEQSLAHELGHVLGFAHVPPESGYIMSSSYGWSEEESSLAQLAYRVGPNIRYPGLVRAGAEVDPDQASPDRAALMALYNTTDGNNWTDSANWDTDEPIDHWHGVKTDDAGRVVRLDLHVNNLTGSIPPELDTLINLEELKLDNNNLTGPIPAELGALTNLELLHLWGNNLTGPIPPELGRLSNLDVLALYNNNLTGPIPPELGDLTNLTYLWVTNNNLTGPLPSSMTNLGRLEYLGIENNAGLCAPADAPFQAWLATVKDFRGETCAHEVPTVPLLAQMLLALLLLCGGAYYRVRQVRHWAR